MLLGIGDGTFSNAISYQAGGTNALAVAMGDVNGDGKVDVIVASNCLQQQRLFYWVRKRIDEQRRRHPPVPGYLWIRRTKFAVCRARGRQR